jgi:hypothetical protein
MTINATSRESLKTARELSLRFHTNAFADKLKEIRQIREKDFNVSTTKGLRQKGVCLYNADRV